jgi:hypothetical protein
MMPIRARPSGIPTAQPTITGRFDFFLEGSAGGGVDVEVGMGVGVTEMTDVMTIVEMPFDPEDTEVR